jgi:diguanylate cyclase (GGDEF)-like protein/PAS domain S-box-containing protein
MNPPAPAAASGLLPSSLKSRLTSVVIVLVLSATVLVTLVALLLAERDMKGVIGHQQYALLSSAAAFIDDRLAAKKQLMAALAADMPSAARDDPLQLRAYLDARSAIAGEFINLAVFKRNGELVGSRLKPRVQALSALGKQYFDETLARRHGIVSEPFISALSGKTVVLVTSVVLDKQGEVALVLTGGVDLKHANYLQTISTLYPGKTGFIFVMTHAGILVEHPDKSRLLQHINATPGINKATMMALGGFEGWTEALNKEGVNGIYAYKRLKAADWIVGARYPTEEAFAPIIALRQHGMLAAATLAALAGLLAWALIGKLMAPLDTLRDSIARIRRKEAGIGLLRDSGKDEIGELGRAFHELMAEREEAQERMASTAKRARVIADAIPALISYVNSEERYEFTNAHYQTMLGLDPKAMIGRTIREVFGSRVYARLQPRVAGALRGERMHFEHDVLDRPVHYLIDYIPDVADNGAVKGFYIMVMDISERKRAELTQARSEKRLKLITDNLPVLIAYLDREHKFRFGNATFQKWFGVAQEALVSQALHTVIGANAYRLAKPHLERAFLGESVCFEMRVDIGGRRRVLETSYIPDIQGDGSVAGIYALTHDMTHVKEVEEQLTLLARSDALTGIANRRLFGETLLLALERARRHGNPLGLAYLDIDRFKKINDTHGHGVGDEVLKEFAQRLVEQVRQVDTVARLSGDEFVIILEDSGTHAELERLAAKILDAVRQPFSTSAGTLMVTASIGIALFKGEGQSQDALLADADQALYEAKRQGRDRVVVQGPA